MTEANPTQHRMEVNACVQNYRHYKSERQKAQALGTEEMATFTMSVQQMKEFVAARDAIEAKLAAEGWSR
ncbi:MAG: hypothetical protein ACQES2_00610 [Pseudomonadota bacterium]